MHTPAPSRSRPRAGITVVEVLVALMLVTVGMMAIAGSSALALRSAHDSARRREAAQRATTRLAQLAAAGCPSASSGSSADSTRQLFEHWWVVSRANGVAILTDSVDWTSARGRKSFAITTGVAC
ncbi:MAG: hypothetical protein ABJE47_02795 [bacterium]